MPLQGKFYTSAELQKILNVSKQRVSNIASDRNWTTLVPGLYCAEDVEAYLHLRNIDPQRLSVRTYYEPEGATFLERAEQLPE